MIYNSIINSICIHMLLYMISILYNIYIYDKLIYLIDIFKHFKLRILFIQVGKYIINNIYI